MLSDAVEASTSGVLSLHRETTFIIGIDFAVNLSSPESFCVLFDITSEPLVELKWLLLKNTSEIALGQYVCELVVGVDVFDLDLGVQIDSIEQPIKSNSVGSGNVSHCGTPSLCNHLDHCYVVFKHIQQSFLMGRVDV